MHLAKVKPTAKSSVVVALDSTVATLVLRQSLQVHSTTSTSDPLQLVHPPPAAIHTTVCTSIEMLQQ